MLTIGRKGLFTLSPPYQLPAVEYEVMAIQSLAALHVMGLDPYALIYAQAGYDREYYKTIDQHTQVYLLKSATDRRYIPADAVLHTDTSSYVTYADKAIVMQVGAHPINSSFTQLVHSLYNTVTAQLGVRPVIDVRDVSLPAQLTTDRHLDISSSRKEVSTNARPINVETQRELEISALQTKLKTLELFLLQYTQQCNAEECPACFATEVSYPDTTVFYQYTLADFYLQSQRGDVHDLPHNNAFITKLHELFAPKLMII
jgi:hypothetical protein